MCKRAFDLAKQLLSSAPVIAHHDPSLPLVLTCDASAYGHGVIITHRLPYGSEKPVAYASRTLGASECNYAQIEEALSVVYGVQKFHQYLYGRPFTLVTDHKPLTTILGVKEGIPAMIAARLQRWALILSSYMILILCSGLPQSQALPVTVEQLEVAIQCSEQSPLLRQGRMA